jgi:pilus assembly protein TadC
MILLTSALIAITVGCTAWMLIYRYQNRRLVSHRLSNLPGGLAFPYNIHDATTDGRKSTEEVLLDRLGKDKIAKNLFLAGLRNQRNVKFFHFLVKLSLIVPGCLLLGYALQGQLRINGLFMAVGIGCAIFFGVHFLIRILKLKRQKKILRSLPQLLDLVVVCVEAGLSFPSALERILKEADMKDPLVQEFSTMYHEFLGGIALTNACQRMDKRCEVAELSLLLSAIVQTDQIGSSLGSSLRVQAIELRDKLKQRIRQRAFRVPVKILFPMLLIFISFIILNLGYIGFQLKNALGTNRTGSSSQSQGTGIPVYRP